MAKIDNDEVSNNSGNPSFQEIVEARLSRRGFLGGGLAAAAAFSFSGVNALLRSVPASAQDIGQGSLRPLLGFQGVAVSDADSLVVPPRYSARVLVAWGDPVSNGPEFEQDGSNSAADQAQQWGMHNDGWCTSQSRDQRMACSSKTMSTPMMGCCFAMASPTGMKKRPTNRSTLMVSRSSRLSINAASGRWCARQDMGGGSRPRLRLLSVARRLEMSD